MVSLRLRSTMPLDHTGFQDGNGERVTTPALKSAKLTLSRRLFLSEGIVTVVVGVSVWFLLPDCKFSVKSHFLSGSC